MTIGGMSASDNDIRTRASQRQGDFETDSCCRSCDYGKFSYFRGEFVANRGCDSFK